MTITESKEDAITLRGKEIPIQTGYMPHKDLLFYSENPRIYSMVWDDSGVEPTQQQIFDAISSSQHVKENLVPSIKNNGGLIEPVMVRKNVVLEGNSRLAAYRLLSIREPGKWDNIRVRILPDSIGDSEVFSLLGEYHIVGKKDWAPYEQAGYLYRRFNAHGVDERILAKEIGITVSKISHLIKVYSFMIKVNDKSSDRWSYYDELLKSRRMNKARELYDDFDVKISEMIKDGVIERAVDVRDGLPKIVAAGGNTLKRFMNGKLSYGDAVVDANNRGGGDYFGKKIKDFRLWLSEDACEMNPSEMSPEKRKEIIYYLNRLSKDIANLQKKLNID